MDHQDADLDHSGRGRDIGASIRDIDIGWKNKVIGGNRAIGGDRAIDGDISRKIRGWNNDSCGMVWRWQIDLPAEK